MTVINNATLILKDKQGNEGVVKSFTDNDINKIANAITDVGQVVDPATHMPIEATTASIGVVQLATAQDITNGTANKVVDAKELNNFAQTLPAANGVTDVSSGDNSNQLVVFRIGGSKTLTIDNVEHAGTATSADSVAWDNVSNKPSSYTPASHTHDDRYFTESEIDTKLSDLFLKVYPVGSIYISANSTNPGTLFGGTWTALDQGRVLIGANSTYAAGTTGGEFTHTITTDEMPSHAHSGSTGYESANHTHSGSTGWQSADHVHGFSGTTSYSGDHGHSAWTDSQGWHQHNSGIGYHYVAGIDANDPSTRRCLSNAYIASDGNSENVTSGNGAHGHNVGIGGAGNHAHTYSGTTGGVSANHYHDFTTGGVSANHYHGFTTGASGSGWAMNNMQPYLAVYMWQRTA